MALLRRCLTAIREQGARARVAIHVVDNASQDGTLAMLRREFPEVHVTANAENLGFARAVNQSWPAEAASARYWLLLNPDAVPQPGCLDALVSFMDVHHRAGLVSPLILGPDGVPQYSAQPAPGVPRVLLEAVRIHKLLPRAARARLLLGSYWSYDTSVEVGWTWGTALMARREAVEQVGPLNGDFFMYGEDVEWCLRMRRARWEVWLCAEAAVVHEGGASAHQRWSLAERGRHQMEGYYRAVALDRGPLRARALRAAMLLALLAESAACRLRGRERSPGLVEALAYHRGRPI
jgi:N-acetylglucosaminyl-diphospho-decaprenol L-rhamnosyltransferase